MKRPLFKFEAESQAGRHRVVGGHLVEGLNDIDVCQVVPLDRLNVQVLDSVLVYIEFCASVEEEQDDGQFLAYSLDLPNQAHRLLINNLLMRIRMDERDNNVDLGIC